MDETRFDALTRRASLAGLGAAALLAVAPGAARAGKAGKKARKRCKRQGAQCVRFLETERCAPDMLARGAGAEGTPAACVEELRPCCALLAKCKAAEALSCLLVA